MPLRLGVTLNFIVEIIFWIVWKIIYDIYSNYQTGKELCESLEEKYKIEDVGSKKFILGKFLKFSIVDSKSVVSQVEEIQRMIHELLAKGCKVNEHFQVGTIIEKLPPSWNHFKIYLKHMRREVKMEDLIIRRWVEEDHWKGDKINSSAFEGKVNIIEDKKKKKKNKQTRTKV